MNESRSFILLLIAVLLILSIAMVLPFLQFFLLTVLLAYILMPIQHRLENRLSPKLAAVSIVFAAMVVVILPLLFVIRIAVGEATDLIEAIQEGELDFEAVEARIEEQTGYEADLLTQLQNAAEGIEVASLVGVIDTIMHTLVGIGLMIFLLYYFLKDGDKFIQWLHETVPLAESVRDRLFTELDQIMKAVLVGHILVALIQGILAGIGLVVTGIPNAILWTVLMVILSLLPIVGSFLIWGPAALYLAFEGQILFGVFLALWGTLVVGVSDDYLRPIIVDRYAQVNPAVIIIGVLGGIYAFGIMGIFFGPLIIGILRSTIDVFREEFDSNE